MILALAVPAVSLAQIAPLPRIQSRLETGPKVVTEPVVVADIVTRPGIGESVVNGSAARKSEEQRDAGPEPIALASDRARFVTESSAFVEPVAKSSASIDNAAVTSARVEEAKAFTTLVENRSVVVREPGDGRLALIIIAGAAAIGLALVAITLAKAARRRRRRQRRVLRKIETGPAGEAILRSVGQPGSSDANRNLARDGNITRADVAARRRRKAQDARRAARMVRQTSFTNDPGKAAKRKPAADPHSSPEKVLRGDGTAKITAANTPIRPPISVAAIAAVRTSEDCDQIIDLLTHAPPDAAIPVSTPGARRRRARLIVQTYMQRLVDTPNFDFDRFYREFGSGPEANGAAAAPATT